MLLNFQGALRSLLPHADAVCLPWRDGENYDEWEAIASALFESLVVFPIRTSLDERSWSEIKFPPYEMLQRDVATLSVLEVLPKLDSGTRVFYGLSSAMHPFDSCRWYSALADGTLASKELRTTPLDECEFSARLCIGGRTRVLNAVVLPAGRRSS